MLLAWLNQLNQVQLGKNFSYILPPIASQNYLLQIIRETNISIFYISFIVFCSLDALKKTLKKKETRIKMEIVKVSQPLVTAERDRDMTFLALTSYLLVRITLNLISSFAMTGCFQKVNFQGFNLVILNFELPSAFFYALCKLL